MNTPEVIHSFLRSRGLRVMLFVFIGWLVSRYEVRCGLFYPGVSPATVLWTNGIIPYEFDTNYTITAAQKATYLDGLREWELAANVKIVPRTNQTQYLLLRFAFQSGNDTFVLGTPPVLTVDNLQRSQLCHEMGHALGLDHEQVRVDRDNYVAINFTNIGFGAAYLYDISTNGVTNGVYDFESVMHYDRRVFAINPDLDVIYPQPPYFANYYYRIGNRALSVGDRAAAAFLYGPPATPPTSVVTNTHDGGPGSLRAAIYYANDHPGTTVTFNIPTNDPGFSNGVWTIKTTGQMPPLVADNTVIDGGTQPGYTNHPLVALDGSTILPETYDTSGLVVYAANCSVKKLAFINYQYCGFIFETVSATNNTVSGCHLGIDAAGTNSAPNSYGVTAFLGASDNRIGGTNAGDRNVISGNLHFGVFLSDTNTARNTILGNYIGLGIAGTNAVPNVEGGIAIFGASKSNIVGGTVAAARNVISGNGMGIAIADAGSDANVIVGNYIGTDATGTIGVSNKVHGVEIVGGAKNNRVGGTNAAARNVISGNFDYGVVVTDSGTDNTLVQGNFVGTDATGTFAVPNANGIGVFAQARDTTVGGVGAGNVVSGNFFTGIVITDPGTSNTVVQGNWVGTDVGGTAPVPNTNGISVFNQARNTIIGGTNAGMRNLVSGNHGTGILSTGVDTVGTVVQGNYIGVSSNGTAALGNEGDGISVSSGAQGTLLGGLGAGAGNLVSGNGGTGVALYNTASVLIQGNIIGADKTGTVALTNHGDGVALFFCSQSTVGGATVGAANLISGNAGQGVSIGGGAANNVIAGNLIGTRSNGLSALPNGGSGFYIYGGAQSNTIGGLTAAARNIISGNGQSGMLILGGGTAGNMVLGNFIGTDVSGNSPLGNAAEGVGLFTGPQNNQIGGGTAGAGNVIGASGLRGVFISDAGTSYNLIQGNSIGVGANGTTPLTNGLEGVLIVSGAGTNLVGLNTNGSGAGNRIAFSTGAGVYIGYFDDTNTVGNMIRGNSIHDNGGLGIDLLGGMEIYPYGITANDADDADSGPNNFQNYPTITNIFASGSLTTIAGSLNSDPDRAFLIDVYRNIAADPSGHGEGEIYAGHASLNTDGSGNGTFSLAIIGNFAGQYFTATATDSQTGDTSEFSLAQPATNAPAPAQFTGPFTQTATGFVLRLEVQTNFPMRIQAATNLATNPIAWVTLTNFTPTNTPIQFTDRGATNYRMRFYRVVSP
jgi:hypothetical protein